MQASWEGNIMTMAPNFGEGEVWEENILHMLEAHGLDIDEDHQ